jgi:aconitate hydratase
MAGTMLIDFDKEPLGTDESGNPVFLKDIWPDEEEVTRYIDRYVKPEMYRDAYSVVFEGSEHWKNLPVPEGAIYDWDPASTYIKSPLFLEDISREVPELKNIEKARILALLGDTVTTDHISPAGAIPEDSPAGKYLVSLGVKPSDFNSFGSRRGNHEVMMRGTFGNIRLSNQLVPGVSGGWTKHFPDGEQMSIFDAAMKYQSEDTPLIVIAGKEYGTGSSRDWAAKGTWLLGVKAVIAKSYERIHRSNLVCMGVLPLQFMEGEDASSLGLDGTETFDITGIEKGLEPGGEITVTAHADGKKTEFTVLVRIDTPVELEYYRHQGILPYVLRQL